MSAVIFHLIDDPDTEAFWFYAAELCAQAAEAEHMTYVVCANLAHVESFDDYLWGYKPDAFVPHTADPEDIAHAPVFLGVDAAAGGFDYVINLSGKPIERVADRVQRRACHPAARACHQRNQPGPALLNISTGDQAGRVPCQQSGRQRAERDRGADKSAAGKEQCGSGHRAHNPAESLGESF